MIELSVIVYCSLNHGLYPQHHKEQANKQTNKKTTEAAQIIHLLAIMCCGQGLPGMACLFSM
jgi:gamma-glutamylcyclotransferase (GGCT)/AIG2-like uncharacterized protein YtfP